MSQAPSPAGSTVNSPKYLFRQRETVRKRIHVSKTWHRLPVCAKDGVYFLLRPFHTFWVREHSHYKPQQGYGSCVRPRFDRRTKNYLKSSNLSDDDNILSINLP